MEIVIQDLTKRFSKDFVALNRLNFKIEPGMFGLLGPNGAGKTTLMRILTTLLKPDDGKVQFGDFDLVKQPQEVRKIVGYLPQEIGFYQELTAPNT